MGRKFTNYTAMAIFALAPPTPTAAQDREAIDRLETAIQPAHRSLLPRGADGVCNTHSREGVYDEALPEPYRTFVARHEIAHNLGSRDEYATDLAAAARTGHVRFVRGPFYQPPIR